MSQKPDRGLYLFYGQNIDLKVCVNGRYRTSVKSLIWLLDSHIACTANKNSIREVRMLWEYAFQQTTNQKRHKDDTEIIFQRVRLIHVDKITSFNQNLYYFGKISEQWCLSSLVNNKRISGIDGQINRRKALCQIEGWIAMTIIVKTMTALKNLFFFMIVAISLCERRYRMPVTESLLYITLEQRYHQMDAGIFLPEFTLRCITKLNYLVRNRNRFSSNL